MQKDPDLSPVERLAIHELISLYGHLVDQRQFSQLGRIFTDDAVFDLGKYDGSCYRGLPAIQTMMLASSDIRWRTMPQTSWYWRRRMVSQSFPKESASARAGE